MENLTNNSYNIYDNQTKIIKSFNYPNHAWNIKDSETILIDDLDFSEL